MKDLAGDDPFELVGVTNPGSMTEENDRHMARCLIEEYALSGWSAYEIGELFVSPAFGLPNAIHRRRGDEFIRTLITEVFGARR